MNLPYSDEYLIYDLKTHRYNVTAKAMFDKYNENMPEKFKDQKNIEPFLRQASLQVYSFIHAHNVNTPMQDYIIAKTESGRRIIQEAIENQTLYLLTVGNVSRSLDRDHRAMYIDEMAREVLMQDLPEIGTTICYAGNLRFCTTDQTEW